MRVEQQWSTTDELSKVVNRSQQGRQTQIVCPLDSLGWRKIGFNVDTGEIEERVFVIVGVFRLGLGVVSLCQSSCTNAL